MSELDFRRMRRVNQKYVNWGKLILTREIGNIFLNLLMKKKKRGQNILHFLGWKDKRKCRRFVMSPKMAKKKNYYFDCPRCKKQKSISGFTSKVRPGQSKVRPGQSLYFFRSKCGDFLKTCLMGYHASRN